MSSGDLNKYEFLKKKDLNYKPNTLDKARFEFSPLGRAFNEGLDETIPNYQEEGVIKLLKKIRDNLADGVNRPAGLIIPPGPAGPQGPPSPQGPPGPLTPAPRTTINTQMPLPPIITTINTQIPLPPIITTINTKLLPTPSLSSLPTPSLSSLPTLTPIPISVSTPSRIPNPILTPSRIPTPILTLLDKSKIFTPFNIKRPSKDPLHNIKKSSIDPLDNIKPSSKVSYDNNNGDIDDDILYNYRLYNPGPGTRTAIIAMENDIKNTYDSINYLQNKLLDAKDYDERNKILNDIDLAKKSIPKKEKELNYLKMGLIKKREIDKKPTTKN